MKLRIGSDLKQRKRGKTNSSCKIKWNGWKSVSKIVGEMRTNRSHIGW